MIKPLSLFALLVTLSISYPATEAMGQLTTPPAQQPTNDGVLILGSSQISTDFGSTYIVGEVRNNLSDVNLRLILIVVGQDY
jgi:hypothetical protein